MHNAGTDSAEELSSVLFFLDHNFTFGFHFRQNAVPFEPASAVFRIVQRIISPVLSFCCIHGLSFLAVGPDLASCIKPINCHHNIDLVP
jgi:hypothetical protein